jgi:hypothetical protein
MATRAMSFEMDESDVLELEQVASVFGMTVTDVIKEAVREYIQYVRKMKEDPFYRLTASVQEASAEETAEILGIIERLSNDDLTITSSERISV